MPTPMEEAAALVAADARATGEYLPSPPESPAYSRLVDQYAQDGADDNTAGGMAMAQEQSLYNRDIRQPSTLTCDCDSEKQGSQNLVTRDPAASEDAASSTLQCPTTGEEEEDVEETEPSVEATLTRRFEELTAAPPGATKADSHPRTAPERSSRPDLCLSEVRNALFTPSPPPASTSNSDSKTASIATNIDSVHGLSSDFTQLRIRPSFTSSFFRPGSRFSGTQQSDQRIYNVDVEILNVSIPDSSLSGYLKICGLTDSHPTLTTYFEGEIIGTRHTFQTRHSDWGATDKTDMQHWARFPAWRPLAKEARRPGFSFGKGWWNRENIFMRWKERFLVPDHRVRTIQGASFEGFYYICYNQVEGRISGIYFHAKSEKYQQLELKHLQDQGCLGAMEFR